VLGRAVSGLRGLIPRGHAADVAALKAAGQSLTTGELDLTELHALLSRLLQEQLSRRGSEEQGNPRWPDHFVPGQLKP
jgi:hypothetical protein